MQEFVDLGQLRDLYTAAQEWAMTKVFVWSVLLQVVLLAIIFSLATYFSRRLQPVLSKRVEKLAGPPDLRPAARLLVLHIRAILFLAIVWLAIGVLVQVTWPSQTYFLRLVANLMTAWIVISLSSSLIRNPVLGRFIALFAWGVAALNITGLLDPTIATLDSAAVTLGDLRISLLTVVKGVISFAVLLWGAVALSRLLETRINRIPNLTPSVQVLLTKLTKITLLSIAVVFALKSIGIDLTALAVLSGAIGLGIGFGLQKVVSNLISGVILLLDKSIKPGDVIELEETFGWITSLGARYVSVVTRDGKEYLIPNEDLITHRVVNWSYSSKLVRLELQFGVSYDSDPHAVRKLAREAAATVKRVVADPAPVCHLAEFADSSLNFLLRFWIRDPAGGVANVRGEVLLALWDAFKANGIAIPYPHREIILRRAGAAEPGTASI
jgi:small-conductance mechanosensitive channel